MRKCFSGEFIPVQSWIWFLEKSRLYGIEVKYAQAPSFSPSMKSAFSELSLKYLWIIYPGKESYLLNQKAMVLSATEIEKIDVFLN